MADTLEKIIIDFEARTDQFSQKSRDAFASIKEQVQEAERFAIESQQRLEKSEKELAIRRKQVAKLDLEQLEKEQEAALIRFAKIQEQLASKEKSIQTRKNAGGAEASPDEQNEIAALNAEKKAIQELLALQIRKEDILNAGTKADIARRAALLKFLQDSEKGLEKQLLLDASIAQTNIEQSRIIQAKARIELDQIARAEQAAKNNSENSSKFLENQQRELAILNKRAAAIESVAVAERAKLKELEEAKAKIDATSGKDLSAEARAKSLGEIARQTTASQASLAELDKQLGKVNASIKDAFRADALAPVQRKIAEIRGELDTLDRTDKSAKNQKQIADLDKQLNGLLKTATRITQDLKNNPIEFNVDEKGFEFLSVQFDKLQKRREELISAFTQQKAFGVVTEEDQQNLENIREALEDTNKAIVALNDNPFILTKNLRTAEANVIRLRQELDAVGPTSNRAFDIKQKLTDAEAGLARARNEAAKFKTALGGIRPTLNDLEKGLKELERKRKYETPFGDELVKLNAEIKKTQEEIDKIQGKTKEGFSAIGTITESGTEGFTRFGQSIGIPSAQLSKLTTAVGPLAVAIGGSVVVLGGLAAGLTAAGVAASNLAKDQLGVVRATGATAATAQTLTTILGNSRNASETLIQINQRITEAAQGSDDARRQFERLGLQFRDTAGNARSVENVFRDIVKRTKDVGLSLADLSALQEIFGEEASKKLLPVLSRFNELENVTKRAGLVLKNDVALGAERLSVNIDKTKLSLEGLATQIGLAVVPAFNTLTQRFTDVLLRFSDSQSFKSALDKLGRFAEDFAEGPGDVLIETLGGIAQTATFLGTGIAETLDILNGKLTVLGDDTRVRVPGILTVLPKAVEGALTSVDLLTTGLSDSLNELLDTGDLLSTNFSGFFATLTGSAAERAKNSLKDQAALSREILQEQLKLKEQTAVNIDGNNRVATTYDSLKKSIELVNRAIERSGEVSRETAELQVKAAARERAALDQKLREGFGSELDLARKIQAEREANAKKSAEVETSVIEGRKGAILKFSAIARSAEEEIARVRENLFKQAVLGEIETSTVRSKIVASFKDIVAASGKEELIIAQQVALTNRSIREAGIREIQQLEQDRFKAQAALLKQEAEEIARVSELEEDAAKRSLDLVKFENAERLRQLKTIQDARINSINSQNAAEKQRIQDQLLDLEEEAKKKNLATVEFFARRDAIFKASQDRIAEREAQAERARAVFDAERLKRLQDIADREFQLEVQKTKNANAKADAELKVREKSVEATIAKIKEDEAALTREIDEQERLRNITHEEAATKRAVATQQSLAKELEALQNFVKAEKQRKEEGLSSLVNKKDDFKALEERIASFNKKNEENAIVSSAKIRDAQIADIDAVIARRTVAIEKEKVEREIATVKFIEDSRARGISEIEINELIKNDQLKSINEVISLKRAEISASIAQADAIDTIKKKQIELIKLEEERRKLVNDISGAFTNQVAAANRAAAESTNNAIKSLSDQATKSASEIGEALSFSFNPDDLEDANDQLERLNENFLKLQQEGFFQLAAAFEALADKLKALIDEEKKRQEELTKLEEEKFVNDITAQAKDALEQFVLDAVELEREHAFRLRQLRKQTSQIDAELQQEERELLAEHNKELADIDADFAEKNLKQKRKELEDLYAEQLKFDDKIRELKLKNRLEEFSKDRDFIKSRASLSKDLKDAEKELGNTVDDDARKELNIRIAEIKSQLAAINQANDDRKDREDRRRKALGGLDDEFRKKRAGVKTKEELEQLNREFDAAKGNVDAKFKLEEQFKKDLADLQALGDQEAIAALKKSYEAEVAALDQNLKDEQAAIKADIERKKDLRKLEEEEERADYEKRRAEQELRNQEELQSIREQAAARLIAVQEQIRAENKAYADQVIELQGRFAEALANIAGQLKNANSDLFKFFVEIARSAGLGDAAIAALLDKLQKISQKVADDAAFDKKKQEKEDSKNDGKDKPPVVGGGNREAAPGSLDVDSNRQSQGLNNSDNRSANNFQGEQLSPVSLPDLDKPIDESFTPPETKIPSRALSEVMTALWLRYLEGRISKKRLTARLDRLNEKGLFNDKQQGELQGLIFSYTDISDAGKIEFLDRVKAILGEAAGQRVAIKTLTPPKIADEDSGDILPPDFLPTTNKSAVPKQVGTDQDLDGGDEAAPKDVKKSLVRVYRRYKKAAISGAMFTTKVLMLVGKQISDANAQEVLKAYLESMGKAEIFADIMLGKFKQELAIDIAKLKPTDDIGEGPIATEEGGEGTAVGNTTTDVKSTLPDIQLDNGPTLKIFNLVMGVRKSLLSGTISTRTAKRKLNKIKRLSKNDIATILASLRLPDPEFMEVLEKILQIEEKSGIDLGNLNAVAQSKQDLPQTDEPEITPSVPPKNDTGNASNKNNAGNTGVARPLVSSTEELIKRIISLYKQFSPGKVKKKLKVLVSEGTLTKILADQVLYHIQNASGVADLQDRLEDLFNKTSQDEPPAPPIEDIDGSAGGDTEEPADVPVEPRPTDNGGGPRSSPGQTPIVRNLRSLLLRLWERLHLDRTLSKKQLGRRLKNLAKAGFIPVDKVGKLQSIIIGRSQQELLDYIDGELSTFADKDVPRKPDEPDEFAGDDSVGSDEEPEVDGGRGPVGGTRGDKGGSGPSNPKTKPTDPRSVVEIIKSLYQKVQKNQITVRQVNLDLFGLKKEGKISESQALEIYVALYNAKSKEEFLVRLMKILSDKVADIQPPSETDTSTTDGAGAPIEEATITSAGGSSASKLDQIDVSKQQSKKKPPLPKAKSKTEVRDGLLKVYKEDFLPSKPKYNSERVSTFLLAAEREGVILRKNSEAMLGYMLGFPSEADLIAFIDIELGIVAKPVPPSTPPKDNTGGGGSGGSDSSGGDGQGGSSGKDSPPSTQSDNSDDGTGFILNPSLSAEETATLAGLVARICQIYEENFDRATKTKKNLAAASAALLQVEKQSKGAISRDAIAAIFGKMFAFPTTQELKLFTEVKIGLKIPKPAPAPGGDNGGGGGSGGGNNNGDPIGGDNGGFIPDFDTGGGADGNGITQFQLPTPPNDPEARRLLPKLIGRFKDDMIAIFTCYVKNRILFGPYTTFLYNTGYRYLNSLIAAKKIKVTNARKLKRLFNFEGTSNGIIGQFETTIEEILREETQLEKDLLAADNGGGAPPADDKPGPDDSPRLPPEVDPRTSIDSTNNNSTGISADEAVEPIVGGGGLDIQGRVQGDEAAAITPKRLLDTISSLYEGNYKVPVAGARAQKVPLVDTYVTKLQQAGRVTIRLAAALMAINRAAPMPARFRLSVAQLLGLDGQVDADVNSLFETENRTSSVAQESNQTSGVQTENPAVTSSDSATDSKTGGGGGGQVQQYTISKFLRELRSAFAAKPKNNIGMRGAISRAMSELSISKEQAQAIKKAFDQEFIVEVFVNRVKSILGIEQTGSDGEPGSDLAVGNSNAVGADVEGTGSGAGNSIGNAFPVDSNAAGSNNNGARGDTNISITVNLPPDADISTRQSVELLAEKVGEVVHRKMSDRQLKALGGGAITR